MKAKEPLSKVIPVEAVQERDIDLLILEELKCNSKFTGWILSETIDLRKNYEFIGAWHSLSQVGLGESDLAFKIKTKSELILFLIENKIDADFQPDQANRYRQRGQKRVDNGECEVFYTILIAPKNYITQNDDFDFYIEYEAIKDWFLTHSGLGKRATYKAEVLEIAIEKQRRGYTAIVDESATKFWWAYYGYANENYPHLKMKKPQAGLPKGSSFITFEPSGIGLGKRDVIIHKGYGVVDLQLFGKGDEISSLVEKFQGTLSGDMEIVKANKSASIRIEVVAIDVTKEFSKQKEIIANALGKADRLYHWAKKNNLNNL